VLRLEKPGERASREEMAAEAMEQKGGGGKEEERWVRKKQVVSSEMVEVPLEGKRLTRKREKEKRAAKDLNASSSSGGG